MSDERFKASEEIADRENTISESGRYVKGRIYRALPNEDGAKFDNRIVMMLWRPAVTCPEIFGAFYTNDFWDFKATVKGHWVTDEVEGFNSFVYCPEATAQYYAQLFKKSFEHGSCPICRTGGKISSRCIFQVFDYQKLIGERPMDEGEEKPLLQVYVGPDTVYKQLFSKYKAGYQFWDKNIIRITKDTTQGKRFTDYTVEVEAREPTEIITNQNLKAYMLDERNFVNPVPDGIKLVAPENAVCAPPEKKTKREEAPTSQRRAPDARDTGARGAAAPGPDPYAPPPAAQAPAGSATQPAGGERKLRW